MKKYSNEEFDKIKGIVIGRGAEKTCYLHRQNGGHCLKVSSKFKCSQIVREIEYFEYLEKKKIRTNFLPKYFGSFECGELIGFEQECFLNETSGGMCKSATTLKNYILDINVSDEDISRHLNALKCEMLKSCIVCGDLHGENILAINEEGKWRLVIIDGFGVPEFVPLPMYFKWFRKRKILRQWEKLERRLKAIFTERLELLKK